MDPNFTPGSDEHEQQLFQEQQDFLYSVLISSLTAEFRQPLPVQSHLEMPGILVPLGHIQHT